MLFTVMLQVLVAFGLIGLGRELYMQRKAKQHEQEERSLKRQAGRRDKARTVAIHSKSIQ